MLCWLGSISGGGGIGLASKTPEMVHGVGGVDRGIPFPFTPSECSPLVVGFPPRQRVSSLTDVITQHTYQPPPPLDVAAQQSRC